MCEYITVEKIRSWDINNLGWYINPEGDKNIKLGYNVSIGNHVTIGNNVSIGNNVWIGNDTVIDVAVIIGNQVIIGNNTTISSYVSIEDYVNIGNDVIIGDSTIIRDPVTIRDDVRIGRDVIIGGYSIISKGVKIGNSSLIGTESRLGCNVIISDNISLPNNISIRDNETTLELAKYFRELWKARGDSVIFTKWITKERMSPNFDGGIPIKYVKGETVEVNDCEENDQQCAAGLHVLEFGHQPEWYGLCSPEHGLIPIRVEVKTGDILFGGLPGMTGKYRVRKLKILD